MSNKKYRLLKDIDTPAFICKKGTVGERDNTLHRFKVANNPGTFDLSDEFIQNLEKSVFEQWFQEVVEPERIFVTQMYDLNNVYQIQCVRTGFETSAPIPEDKFPAIKQAIEKAINQPEFPTEEIKALTSLYRDMTDHIRQQKYTEADIYKARREGFEAARMNDIPTYATIEDYEKSLVK